MVLPGGGASCLCHAVPVKRPRKQQNSRELLPFMRFSLSWGRLEHYHPSCTLMSSPYPPKALQMNRALTAKDWRNVSECADQRADDLYVGDSQWFGELDTVSLARQMSFTCDLRSELRLWQDFAIMLLIAANTYMQSEEKDDQQQ